jgi:hypothetical protein
MTYRIYDRTGPGEPLAPSPTMDEESLLPDNAEVELKRAYNSCIETGVTHEWERRPIPGVDASEVFVLYQKAIDYYQRGTPQARLASERWARVVKHLALAYWHEAKIDYLEPHSEDLPCLPHARTEFHLHAETRETAQALLDSAAQKIRKQRVKNKSEPLRLLERGRAHLEHLASTPVENELLHAEHIKAAHEYGRILEYYLLALEAELHMSEPAA